MSDEEPGILGNLPRARPGTRSEKRDVGSATQASASKNPAAGAKSRPRAAAGASGPASGAAAGRSSARRSAPASAEGPPEPAGGDGLDPVGDLLRAGEALARSGLRVTSAIAGAALRRVTRS